MTIYVAVDEYGRTLVGDPEAIDVLLNPEENLVYTDWHGSSVEKQTLSQEVVPPMVIAIAGLLGGLMLATFNTALAMASIVDRMTGRVGTNKLRYKLDVWLVANPYENNPN